MNDRLQSRLDLFAENTLTIKKEFIWKDVLVKRLAALLYAMEDRRIDCMAIHDSHELIKKNTRILSAFRGNMALNVATLLSLSSDQEILFTNTLCAYDMLKAAKFRTSDFLVIAAYQIASITQADQFVQVIDRAKAFYDGMKEKHWFLTGEDDYIYCAMLGLSDVDIRTGLERMEQLYSALKPQFFSANSVQTLTQVLVLGGEMHETITRLFHIREELRKVRLRLDKEYTLSSLGVLSLLPGDVDEIVGEFVEAHTFLRSQKAFGALSIMGQELLPMVSALVSSSHVDTAKESILSSLCTNITKILIAQHATMASIAASTAAIAASSSSSS